MNHSKTSSYRVDSREGSAHGDLYELEQDYFFDVVDVATQKVVMTFEGHYSGSYTGSCWKETNYVGVRKVEISEDGCFALVYEGDNEALKKVRIE